MYQHTQKKHLNIQLTLQKLEVYTHQPGHNMVHVCNLSMAHVLGKLLSLCVHIGII